MFVSGPRPVRVGKAGQEADGGEVGGGGGGVGLRGGAARRSGAASEVVVWACDVAAAARAAATAPGLRLFVLGALGGVAGVWEAREFVGSPACGGASPLSQRESTCARQGGPCVSLCVVTPRPSTPHTYIAVLELASRVARCPELRGFCMARARERLRTLVKRTI